MARTTDQPSTASRRNEATAEPDTNRSGSFDEQDRRGEGGQFGENAERREDLTAVRDERDNDRNDSHENGDGSRENRDERGNVNRPDDRGGHELSESRGEPKQRDGDAEQDSWREQPPAFSAGLDASAAVLEAWKQVFQSWSELAQTMVKVQQDAFASMIGAANPTVGDRRNGELASCGSRTTASKPDWIERDRR